MSKQAGTATDRWRESRRDAARAALLAAAWQLVREEGLAALTLRELAKRAGITTPTVYAYFPSKMAIFDAMFGQAAEAFRDFKRASSETADPIARLRTDVHRFVEFCTSDLPRYQLLFQRVVPGFEPSRESYAPAVEALADSRALLADAGVTDRSQIDLWTALCIGLVDQQISNDPGGDRWIKLTDEAVQMFLDRYVPRPPRRPARRSAPASRRTT